MHKNFSYQEILKILRQSYLFRNFDVEEIETLIRNCEVEYFDEGQEIIKEGTLNDRVYFILSGSITVFADGENILQLNREGDIFGEMSVISKNPTSATILADSDISLFTISESQIRSSGEKELENILNKVFLDILTRKLTVTTKKVKGFEATTQELGVKKQELAVTEDHLQKKSEILQSVLGSMSDGVVVRDGSGKLLHINAAFQEMVGEVVIPTEIAYWPRKLGLFLPDETTYYPLNDFPLIKAQNGTFVDSEEIFVRNDSHREGLWLHASASPLIGPEGEGVDGVVVVFRDFTKRKKEEQALMLAKEHAEELAKSKSYFLAVMSHELRTPLNSVIGMTDLMLRSNPDEEQKECLDTIKYSGERLLKIVRDILDFNNLESGSVSLEIAPFTISEIFQSIIEENSYEAAKKGHKILLSLDKNLSEKVTGDKGKLQRVVDGLVNNAIKYSEKSKVEISVRQVKEDSDMQRVEFAVKDYGIGLSPEQMEILFQPFTQVDNSLTRKGEGTGIGLSICKHILALMNSHIEIDSEPGKGSKFSFYLDLKKVDETEGNSIDAEKKLEEEIPEQNKEFSSHIPLKILVAEDNSMNQKLIKKVLEKLGYSPVFADNGLIAAQMAAETFFDIVLMDLQMPEMDGFDSAKKILEGKKPGEKPRIVALTANVGDEVREQCRNSGMSDFLSKPLRIDKLAVVLFRWK